MADTLQDKIAKIDDRIYEEVARTYSVGKEEVRQVFNEFANKPVKTKAGTSKTIGEGFSSLFKRKQSNKISSNEGETQSSPEKIKKDSKIFKEVYIKKQDALDNEIKQAAIYNKTKGGDEEKTLTLDQFNKIEKITQGLFPKGNENKRFLAALINTRGIGLERAERRELDLINLGDINSNKALKTKFGLNDLRFQLNRTDPNPRSPRFVDTSIDDPYSKSVGIKNDIYFKTIKRKNDHKTPSFLMEIEVLSRFTDKPVEFVRSVDLELAQKLKEDGAKADDPRYYVKKEISVYPIKTKAGFDAVFNEYEFSSDNAKASDNAKESYKLEALKILVAHGKYELVTQIYDDVYNRNVFGDNGYSLAHEKHDNEILNPDLTWRKSQQQKAVNVLRSIPKKGGNDEKLESKSITEDQKKGRERALEHIFTETFFRDGKTAESGLDNQFIGVDDLKEIYDKANPEFQEKIKTALKASIKKYCQGEYDKDYATGKTYNGKQGHPFDKFAQFAKKIGMGLTEPEYTTYLFAGKGTTEKDNRPHDIYIFLKAGGTLDQEQINLTKDNKAIVEEALDYLLKDEKLSEITKVKICFKYGGWDKYFSSNDKTSKRKLIAKLEEAPPSAPPKAPQVPGADGKSMQASSTSFGTHVASLQGNVGDPKGPQMGG